MENYRVAVVNYPDRRNLVLRYRDPMTGRVFSRSARTANRQLAERAAALWNAELMRGATPKNGNISWNSFRDRYTAEILPSFAAKTRSMIRTVFNSVESLLNPTSLKDLSAGRLSYYQAALRDRGVSESTVRCYLAHLLSALRWAQNLGLIAALPIVLKPQRAKKSRKMKGRPLTDDEFERMLARVESIVGADGAPSWQFYLSGLWTSGLRLAESLQLFWDRDDRLLVDFTGRRPMLRIPAELEKGNRDRLLPMAPEFASLLEQVPADLRRGQVFQPRGLRQNRPIDEDWASRVISRIGRAADIRVHAHVHTGKIKYATAHDLRRSFAERWARKVMPQVLKELMRHESIDTTLSYYVGANAELTADYLWAAYDRPASQEEVADNPPQQRALTNSQAPNRDR